MHIKSTKIGISSLRGLHIQWQLAAVHQTQCSADTRLLCPVLISPRVSYDSRIHLSAKAGVVSKPILIQRG